MSSYAKDSLSHIGEDLSDSAKVLDKLTKDKIPFDENGEQDLESINALDVAQFNQDMSDLISGFEVENMKNVINNITYKPVLTTPFKEKEITKNYLLEYEKKANND